MTTWIKSITVDCEDALPVAAFWAAALGGELDEDSTSDKAYVEAPGWGGVNLWFQRVAEPKTAKNRLHLDLRAPGTVPDEVARLEALGATVQAVHGDDDDRPHRDARPRRQRVLRRALTAPAGYSRAFGRSRSACHRSNARDYPAGGVGPTGCSSSTNGASSLWAT